MGTRQPSPDIEYGLDCSGCVSPPGVDRFTPGETPLYMYIKFWDIVKCPPGSYQPPNGIVFKLTQVAITPCMYYHDGSIWKVDLRLSTGFPAKCLLFLTAIDGYGYFSDSSPPCPVELYRFTNEMVICTPFIGGKLGNAMISWNASVLQVMDDIGITPSATLFSEIHFTAGGNPVIKLCNRRDGTNIRVKIP